VVYRVQFTLLVGIVVLKKASRAVINSLKAGRSVSSASGKREAPQNRDSTAKKEKSQTGFAGRGYAQLHFQTPDHSGKSHSRAEKQWWLKAQIQRKRRERVGNCIAQHISPAEFDVERVFVKARLAQN
jgi:hypothetical protein